MQHARASALRSLLRAARSLPPPVRAKLRANVRDVAELGLGTQPADAATLARLVRWVDGLPKVRASDCGKEEARPRVCAVHAPACLVCVRP